MQISPPIQNALIQSRHMGDFGIRDCTSFPYSLSVIPIPPGYRMPRFFRFLHPLDTVNSIVFLIYFPKVDRMHNFDRLETNSKTRNQAPGCGNVPAARCSFTVFSRLAY